MAQVLHYGDAHKQFEGWHLRVRLAAETGPDLVLEQLSDLVLLVLLHVSSEHASVVPLHFELERECQRAGIRSFEHRRPDAELTQDQG